MRRGDRAQRVPARIDSFKSLRRFPIWVSVVATGVTSTVPLALRNLPPFPPVAAKLIALLARRDTAFGEVARLLSSDAALSAEVLRMANSPFGGRYGTNSILQALSLIGVTRVSSLVVTLSVSRLLQRAARSPMLRRCWQHNLASALIAREFACEFSLDGEQAYMSGLLHDVGRLAPVSYTHLDVYKRQVWW